MTADLDAALADGVLTDDERRALASSLRQLGARCEQAARDLAVGDPLLWFQEQRVASGVAP